jgi:hypothetical protein
MAEQHQHINFSHSDINRYLQGRMSATEMHELERAALQDPFLADAIEGYAAASATTSQQHLDAIATALLQEPKEEARIVPLPRSSSYTKWMRIAVAVIILAGTGTLGWRFIQWSSSGEAKVASVQVAQLDHHMPKAAAPLPAATDTIRAATPVTKDHAAHETAPVSITPAEKKKAVATEAPAVVPGAPQALAANGTAIPPTAFDAERQFKEIEQRASLAKQLSGKVPGISVSAWGQKRDSIPAGALEEAVVVGYGAATKRMLPAKTESAPAKDINYKYTLAGTVTDGSGVPVANATVKPVNGSPVLSTDKQGAFRLRSKDTAATIRVHAAGYNTTMARISNSAPATVKLEEPEESLSDVVVTEMFSRKKTALSQATKDTAYPAGGWQSFQEYVAKKLHKAVDSTGGDQRYTGKEIEMEFLVEKDGNLRDVRIIRSFDETVNDKAIDVLKSGPRWIANGKKKKARVTVRF